MNLRAAILAATREIRAAVVDMEAIAGIDRELTRDELRSAGHLTSRIEAASRRMEDAAVDADMVAAGYVWNGWRWERAAQTVSEDGGGLECKN